MASANDGSRSRSPPSGSRSQRASSPPWPPVATKAVNSDTFDPSELAASSSWSKISAGGYANVYASHMLGQTGEGMPP